VIFYRYFPDIIAVIEHDAMAIFTKYLSLDCPHPVAVSDDLRVATVRRMCREDGINTDCFSECQQAVYSILNNEYVIIFTSSDILLVYY